MGRIVNFVAVAEWDLRFEYYLIEGHNIGVFSVGN